MHVGCVGAGMGCLPLAAANQANRTQSGVSQRLSDPSGLQMMLVVMSGETGGAGRRCHLFYLWLSVAGGRTADCEYLEARVAIDTLKSIGAWLAQHNRRSNVRTIGSGVNAGRGMERNGA